MEGCKESAVVCINGGFVGAHQLALCTENEYHTTLLAVKIHLPTSLWIRHVNNLKHSTPFSVLSTQGTCFFFVPWHTSFDYLGNLEIHGYAGVGVSALIESDPPHTDFCDTASFLNPAMACTLVLLGQYNHVRIVWIIFWLQWSATAWCKVHKDIH